MKHAINVHSIRAIRGLLIKAGCYAALLGVASILAYVLIGHPLIRAIYASGFMADEVMSKRDSVPVTAYLAAVDDIALRVSVYLIAGGCLAAVVLRKPIGMLCAGASALVSWFALFVLLEAFPKLVQPTHVDMLPYFNYRSTYEFDPVLGFRERPWHTAELANFRGSGYSPVYGIDVSPTRISWQTDADGFRNPADSAAVDIVVIGSSFAEYGTDLDDTFPQRLNHALAPLRVAGLSKAGYGPFQYLEVLERYALKRSPHYALFTFYPVSDTDDHLSRWIKGQKDLSLARRSVVFGGFLPRYRVASLQAWHMFASSAWNGLHQLFDMLVPDESIHSDVAVLRLADQVSRKMVFLDQHKAASTEDLLKSPEWRAWENILLALKTVSERNHIVPVLIYIPAATEVYAQYSTNESGRNWLAVRAAQVATSGHNEQAAHILAERVGISMISVRPAFQQAAADGKLVYYQMDAHWNEEGRRIAGNVTAAALREIMAKTNGTRKADRPLIARSDDGIMVRSLDGTIQFWDGRAEQLYGWKKEEAIGRVSHALLQTRFPKSLREIDSTLVKTGSWEGELIHATRNGNHVMVNSRWIWDQEAGAVIEMNTSPGRF
jgi:PAS domain S-box-containing protein